MERTRNRRPPPAPPPIPRRRRGRFDRRRPSLTWIVFRVGFLLFSFCVLLGAGATFYYLHQNGIFDLHENAIGLITHMQPPDNTVVFDRDGNKIGEFFDNYHVFTPVEKLPLVLQNAILAVEDRGFWTHPGYDVRGMIRAALAYLKHRRFEQGASTLTQQIVRNFLLTTEKSLHRKLLEIALAAQLEKHLSKKKILELYTNELFLGNGAYGVGAASLRYFGKPVSQITLPEAALIAGLFQSPTAYNPERYPKKAKARQRHVLEAMMAAGMISLAEAETAYAQPLRFAKYVPSRTQVAPYFVDYIEAEAKNHLGRLKRLRDNGLRIHTTLDSRLQKIAEQAISHAAPTLEQALHETRSIAWQIPGKPPPKIETALIALDPRNGEILAMVGGRNYQENQFNRVTSALRSPGSAFKPVVYSLALARGWKWSDVLYVEPITIDNYRPRNMENDYLTETTLLRAFYRSMNTPTVELGSRIGLGSIIEHARRLGIRSDLKPEIGTVLGGSDVTILDMARMYSVFADGGTLVEPISLTSILDRQGKSLYQAGDVTSRSTAAVVSPVTAYLMTEGLRAVFSHGTAFDAREMASEAVGKTGTSNDATDNWFCGYTPELLTLVWVGTDDHTPLPPSSRGATMALPIWEDFMKKAFALRPPTPFERPPGIVSAQVHPQYGYRVPSGGVKMYFRRGHEPSDKPSALEAVSGNKTYRSIFQDK